MRIFIVFVVILFNSEQIKSSQTEIKKANQCLLHKWALWYRSFDLKKEGVLSREGVFKDEEEFAYLSRLGTEKQNEIAGKFDKLIDQYVFRGNPGPFTEHEFVEMQNDIFTHNKENYTKWAEEFAKTVFDIIDIDDDDTVNENEFLTGLMPAGHDDVKLDKKFFNAYKPVDGKVPVKSIADTWVQFLTSEDCSQQDVVRDAFEGGV